MSDLAATRRSGQTCFKSIPSQVSPYFYDSICTYVEIVGLRTARRAIFRTNKSDSSDVIRSDGPVSSPTDTHLRTAGSALVVEVVVVVEVGLVLVLALRLPETATAAPIRIPMKMPPRDNVPMNHPGPVSRDLLH